MPFLFDEIGSTQIFLKEKVQGGERLNHLEFALAHRQTAGIGRHGRSWVSESGNLFLSVYLSKFDLPLTWIPHWVGLTLLETLETFEPIDLSDLKLKWPNDLVWKERAKLAGVLCEKVGEGVIAGIGVNLISSPELSDRETVSFRELAPHLKEEGLNIELARRLMERMKTEPSLLDLQSRYEKRSLLQKGREIAWVDLQTGKTGEGKFLGYGKLGEILVNAGGKEHPLYSEEIRLKL